MSIMEDRAPTASVLIRHEKHNVVAWAIEADHDRKVNHLECQPMSITGLWCSGGFEL
jgi:hypothetical protein